MFDSVLLILVLGCEIAFWLVLLFGLVARYLLRWQKLGLYCLYSIPLIDLLLLIVTVIDLRNGTEASFFHGLAAAYIGFSVVFGHSLIQWADEHFAYRFANGDKPASTPVGGWPNLRYELILFAKALVACAITFALVRAMMWMVGDFDKTVALYLWDNMMKALAFFWFVFGPLWSVVFRLYRSEPEKDKA